MDLIEAFVITAGFDATAIKKGAREGESALGKMAESARKSGKEIEASSKGMREGLEKATNGVLTLMAAFLGGQGLKQFVGDAVRANTALSNISATLGISSQSVSAWSLAAERLGGSAAATQNTLKTLSDQLLNLNNKGVMPPNDVFMLESASKVHIDLAHGTKRYTETMAEAAGKLGKINPALASNFLRGIGADPVTAQLMIQQGKNLAAYLHEAEKFAATNKEIAAAGGLTAKLADLNSAFGKLGSTLMKDLGPALVPLIEAFTRLVQWLDQIAARHPVWTDAILGVLAAMSGVAMLGAIKNVLSLAGALRGLAAANELSVGGGLLGLLGRLGLYGAAVTGGFVGGRALASVLGIDGYDPYGGDKHYHVGPGGKITYEPSASGSGNDAIRRRGREGRHAYHDTTNYTGSNADVVRQAAKQLGTTPHDLAMAIAYETKGTFSPHIHGGRGGNYQGLIQFGPPERATYGANDKQTFSQQMHAVVSYLKDRGFKPGTDLKNLYSTINAGRPGLYNASDGNGTVSSHVARMQREQEANVQRFLHSGSGNVPQSAPETMPRKSAAAAPSIWTGSLAGARTSLHAGAAQSAALNNIAVNNKATTSSTSNEAHIQQITVNTQATDAHGIARGIDAALAHNLFANHANTGPY